ncbi:MAG: PorT family protein [Prevotellaceae bacterium]|jgi:hypothetical protein|nr:PorT family protein [Prevotellaceae bacterium]
MNRKILIMLIIGVLSTGWVYGQSVRLGARGGFAVPNIIASGDNVLSKGYKSRFAGGGGIFTELDINKQFTVRFGVEYSSQGGKRDGVQGMSTNQMFTDMISRMGTNIPATVAENLLPMAELLPIFYADVKNTAKFEYLMIPLSLQTNLLHADKWKLYVNAGPFFSFLLSAEQISKGKTKLYISADKTTTIYDLIPAAMRQQLESDVPEIAEVLKNGAEFGTSTITGEIRPLNIGVQGNIGASYFLGKNHNIFLETGGNYGFLRLQKDSKNGTNRIGAFTIMFGYAFSIIN